MGFVSSGVFLNDLIGGELCLNCLKTVQFHSTVCDSRNARRRFYILIEWEFDKFEYLYFKHFQYQSAKRSRWDS